MDAGLLVSSESPGLRAGPRPEGTSPGKVVVSLEEVSKTFGETRALVKASLSARAGEIHAIVGENGSGKSTLAKVISGVIRPDAGRVDVLGIVPATPTDAIRAGVATIYQEILLAESLTVLDNLFAGRDLFWRRRVAQADKVRVARQMLGRLVGAPIDPDTRVESLPLPVKQWIVIARALIASPKVLIFDESSAALDLDATRRLHDEMRRLRDEGCCILLVTHRIAELVRIADVATILRDGVTVGRLERGEIEEDRLLELMSAAAVHAAGEAQPRFQEASSPPVLATRGVVTLPGVEPIDFDLYPGQIVGLAGLDGAGHGDFIRLLAGIDPAQAGQVLADGGARGIATLSEAAESGIAYVSGDRKRDGIFPRLSIIENFGMALMRQHGGALGVLDRRRRKVDFDTERARLSIKLGSERNGITTLSGGNQQKVLIGRAFALRPKIILLNDPARGVDIGTKQDLYVHLRAFAAQGGAVVYLSSEIEEFFGFAHRVDVFFKGTLLERLSGSEINEPRILSALFGRRGDLDLNPREAAQ